jgi:hypothetical protein
MRIPEEEVRYAVQAWGYTPREAQFLWIVTAFSGHFLREQYRRYCDISRGKADHGFAERLLRNAHVAGVYAWGKNRRTQRYHVHAKALYRAFGRENSNHRKAPSGNATITVRIAALDFVLSELEPEYLLSVEERLGYLRDVQGVSEGHLIPSRSYPPRGPKGTTPAVSVPFPDRFPMSVASDGTPTFSFIDVPDDGLQPFEAHLVRYAPLLAALKTPARFAFVSGVETKLARAERCFSSVLEGPREPLSTELLRYFALEDRFLRQDFAGLRKRDYDEHCDLAKQFAGPRYRKLFELWRSGVLAQDGSSSGGVGMPSFVAVHAPSLQL